MIQYEVLGQTNNINYNCMRGELYKVNGIKYLGTSSSK